MQLFKDMFDNNSGSERLSDNDLSLDSDTELQKAFEEGKLKGLVNQKPAKQKKVFINNKTGLEAMLEKIKTNHSWIERLDTTVEPVARLETEEEMNDDFKREMIIYRQAQSSVLQAIPRLKQMGIETKRPDVYFAQMAKADSHMTKIREKLRQKKVGLERSEAAKKLRAAKKFGKKVQQEVTLNRQKEKRELAEAVKKHRRGKANNLSELLEGTNDKQRFTKKPKQIGKKSRQQRDKKFGFGGQKKRSKRNTKESVNESWSKSAKRKLGQSKTKQARPGKSVRRKQRNKNK